MSIVLADICVYPVKALRGVHLRRAVVAPQGLVDDRRWVIVDRDGQFVSQRTHPALARVAAQVSPNGLVLTAPDQPQLAVAYPTGEDRAMIRVWRDEVSAAVAAPTADRWLTHVLGESCRLVWMDAACRRPLTGAEGASGSVSFADGYPCLLANEASLADLNERLATPVPMDRFRANLVVSGTHAFAEDDWTRLTIGEVVLRAAGPCARCTVTTVDQVSGHRTGPEPLRTLATYRQSEKGVLFGLNLVVERPGVVQVGDRVGSDGEKHGDPLA